MDVGVRDTQELIYRSRAIFSRANIAMPNNTITSVAIFVKYCMTQIVDYWACYHSILAFSYPPDVFLFCQFRSNWHLNVSCNVVVKIKCMPHVSKIVYVTFSCIDLSYCGSFVFE